MDFHDTAMVVFFGGLKTLQVDHPKGENIVWQIGLSFEGQSLYRVMIRTAWAVPAGQSRFANEKFEFMGTSMLPARTEFRFLRVTLSGVFFEGNAPSVDPQKRGWVYRSSFMSAFQYIPTTCLL